MRVFVSIITMVLGYSVFVSASALEVPIEAFGELANVRGVNISPGGTKIAMLIGSTDEERSIVVQTLGGKATRIPAGEDNALAVRFLNENRIAVYYDKFTARAGGRFKFGDRRLVFMDTNGKKQKQISPAAGFRIIEGDTLHCLMQGVAAQQNSGRAAASGGARVQGLPAYYQVNVNTGKWKIVERGTTEYNSLIMGPDGKGRIRTKGKGFNNRADIRSMDVEVKDLKTGSWKPLLHYEDLDDAPFSFDGFGDDNTVYVTGRFTGVPALERDKVSIYTVDLTTGEIKIFRTNPDVDMGGTLVDPYTHRVSGVYWDDGYQQIEYFDDELAALYEQLGGAFPGKEINLQSWDKMRKKFIVKVAGPGHSGSFYLYEPAAGKVALVAHEYPKIADEQVSQTTYIKYKARDGVMIPAYLTMPVGKAKKNLPMIMLPHGGPRARDNYSSELWRQSFANLGYVVLQPQYRGSEGYGLSWRDAGNQQWGRRMQNDLSDGVKYLIAQGTVDADRICIVGWSYGGYAAMAGATLTPELYRCVIAGAGVSDLVMSLNDSGSNARTAKRGITEWWEESIGDPDHQRKQLRETSPAFHTDNVQAPILLIHGEEDTTVPIKQSETFAKALDKSGKTYEFLRLPNENHNLMKGETRVLQLQTMATFLDKYNPADP